jgi:hypothetical protein
MTLNFDEVWNVRGLVLEMLWIGLINLPTVKDQIILMNAEVFLAMTCSDPCPESLLPDILRVLREIGQSEMANRLTWRAIDSTIEFLQILVEADDPEIVAQANIVLEIYTEE